MPVVNLKVSNSNETLTRIGADEIITFNDGTREAKLCGKIYPNLAKAMIAAYPFTFSKKEMILSKLTDFTPLIRYKNAFALPGDAVLPVYETDQPGLDYKIVGNLIYTNTEELIVKYPVMPDESLWSPNFTMAFIYRLAQELSIALLDDKTKATFYEGEYKKEWIMARNIDSKLQPGDRPSQKWYPLTAVRP